MLKSMSAYLIINSIGVFFIVFNTVKISAHSLNPVLNDHSRDPGMPQEISGNRTLPEMTNTHDDWPSSQNDNSTEFRGNQQDWGNTRNKRHVHVDLGFGHHGHHGHHHHGHHHFGHDDHYHQYPHHHHDDHWH